jgi:hypothetical protein
VAVLVFPGVPSTDDAFSRVRRYVQSQGGQMSSTEQPVVTNGGRQYLQYYGGTRYSQGTSIDWVTYVRSFPQGTVMFSLQAKQGQLVPVLPQLRQIFATFDPGA